MNFPKFLPLKIEERGKRKEERGKRKEEIYRQVTRPGSDLDSTLTPKSNPRTLPGR